MSENISLSPSSPRHPHTSIPTHTSTYIHTYTHSHTHIHPYPHTYSPTPTHIQTHTHPYLHPSIPTHTHPQPPIPTHMLTHLHTHPYPHTYSSTPTHPYPHTYSPTFTPTHMLLSQSTYTHHYRPQPDTPTHGWIHTHHSNLIRQLEVQPYPTGQPTSNPHSKTMESQRAKTGHEVLCRTDPAGAWHGRGCSRPPGTSLAGSGTSWGRRCPVAQTDIYINPCVCAHIIIQ